MIELTEKQQQALAESNGTPPNVLDPKTNRAYVLVPADLYARMQAIVDGVSRRAGWDDPLLDDYERYRKAP